jgi:C1A family cysteine protease
MDHKTPASELRATCHSDRTLPRRRIKHYGWKPDLPDARDRIFDANYAASAHGLRGPVGVPPSRVDLRETNHLPPVYDQLDLGSCTANAIGAAYAYEQEREGIRQFMPSRLFIYYAERQMEGTIREDAGAMIRDGMKAIAKLGVPHESLWKYNVARFADQPSKSAYADALKHQCITYARVGVNFDSVKAALAAQTPVVLGFSVYESFEDTGSDGMVQPGEGQMIGGHAVLAVGYDDARDLVIVRNSWGASWGDRGYCYFPSAWLCDARNADDFWAIQDVEGGKFGS